MRRREPLDPDHAAHNQGTPETRHVNTTHTLQRTAQPDSGENKSRSVVLTDNRSAHHAAN